MNLIQSIKHIYPDAQFGTHFTKLETEVDPQINAWNYDRPQPTDAQIAFAWQAISEKENLQESLEVAYLNFSDGGKWAFGNTYNTVINHIRRGDIAAAKLTVEMVQIPAEVPGVPSEELATWTAKKTEILALFP